MDSGSHLSTNSSVTNGAIIIAVPNAPNLYYLLYINSRYFYYATIDMGKNNGKGKVINKDNYLYQPPLGENMDEKLMAIRHGNGVDWWVMIHKSNTNQFIKYLVTASNISGPYFQRIGTSNGRGYAPSGEISANPNGNKLATVTGNGLIELFDFDRCTGELSNPISLGHDKPQYDLAKEWDNFFYGCSFSPDGSKFYVSNTWELYQFDLNEADIKASKTLVWKHPERNIHNVIGQHQLGPNGKVYIAHWVVIPHKYNQSLSVIHNPNEKGQASNFRSANFFLEGQLSNYGLPNFPNYRLGALPLPPADAGPDTQTACAADSVQIGGPPQPHCLYAWSPSEGLSDASIAQPWASPETSMAYVLTIIDTTRSCRNVNTDTVWVEVQMPVPSFSVEAGEGDTICPGAAMRLGLPPVPGYRYRWWPGEGLDDPLAAQPLARPEQSQYYYLTVTDTRRVCDHIATDSVWVEVHQPQLAEAGPDVKLCEGKEMVEVIGTPGMADWTYSWSPPIGLDDARQAQPQVFTQTSMVYHMTVVKDTFCISHDSVLVTVEPCEHIYLPNAFTPNGDGLNETFEVINLPRNCHLQVWNRWGNLVFQSADYQNDWRAEGLSEGVYVFRLVTADGREYTGSVTVMR